MVMANEEVKTDLLRRETRIKTKTQWKDIIERGSIEIFMLHSSFRTSLTGSIAIDRCLVTVQFWSIKFSSLFFFLTLKDIFVAAQTLTLAE